MLTRARVPLLAVAMAWASVLATVWSLAWAPAWAAEPAWPTRPVTLIVPYPPGGSSDNVARPIQQPLAQALGQPVIIENRGGAGGTLGAALVAQARPDGHTLLLFPTAIMTISPHMMRLPYDPATAFAPVAMLAISEAVLAMHPRVPVRDFAGFLAHARAHPGAFRFSSAGNGTITQMIGEIFADSLRIRLEHVPYRGSAPGLAGLLAGDVELQFDPITMPAVQDGRLVGLVIFAEARNSALPGVPSLRELGIAADLPLSFFGLAAPAGTPAEPIARLQQALAEVLAQPEVARAMAPVSLRPSFESGAAFARRIARDREVFGAAVRSTGARVE